MPSGVIAWATGEAIRRETYRLTLAVIAGLALVLVPGQPKAQELMSPGDAAVTQFSGVSRAPDGTPRPDPDGAVLRLFGLSASEDPPDGRLREAPRQLLTRTARDVGQVFAVAFDGDSPANIYLAATSAYGLYRSAENEDWAAGQWGPDGGPGTIWKLDAERGYRAEIFADIGFLDQPNGGAGLGDLVYDPWHEQLFVSDLESGLIHRLDLRDGSLLESFDHGVDGRTFFFDVPAGEDERLEPVMHDPTAAPSFDECTVEFAGVEEAMPFDSAPECWNYADFRRRVWGLGLFEDPETGGVRLYYAVWGGAALGNAEWADAGADAATSVWSISLTDDGWFDATDVRREAVLPSLDAESQPPHEAPPVTDIVFTDDGRMILAERGVPAPYFEEAAFTQLVEPRQARLLVLARDGDAWSMEGRLAAGYPLREDDPEIRANAAGGVATLDNGLLWFSVDALCSEDAPCPRAGADDFSDRIGGIQGVGTEAVVTMFTDEEEGAGLDGALLFSVRGAGRVPGDMGAVALRPGETVPRRIVERPARPEAPERDVVEEPDTAEVPEPSPDPAELDTDLALAKNSREDCRPGADCEFDITVANEGNAIFDGPLLITDTLGRAGVSLVSTPSPGWDCHSANAHVFCLNEELVLAPGESTELRLTLRIPEEHRQPRLENCAAVTWLGRGGRERIRAVQAELNRRGFDAGSVDGAMGPRTAGAIASAQSRFDLAETGAIDHRLVEELFGSGAWIAGDTNPDTDEACATATVEVPAPPSPPVTAPPPAVTAPPRATPPPPGAPARRHDPDISYFHERRGSAQHNPVTSGPSPIHQPAFSQFHMRHRSSQHDGVRSEFVPSHDAVISRFHQRYDSQAHDIETSGPRRVHTIRESGQRFRTPGHDGVTSGAPMIHEGWTSRWR